MIEIIVFMIIIRIIQLKNVIIIISIIIIIIIAVIVLSAFGPAVRVFANGPGVWVQSQVESYQRL